MKTASVNKVVDPEVLHKAHSVVTIATDNVGQKQTRLDNVAQSYERQNPGVGIVGAGVSEKKANCEKAQGQLAGFMSVISDKLERLTQALQSQQVVAPVVVPAPAGGGHQ